MVGLFGILQEDPRLFVILVVSLLISISIHEFSHAFIANKLGDPTAKNAGRISINPLAHLDPLGTLTLLFAGFGWGKAVPINYYNFKNPKRDAAIVSFAGPGSNFALAILLTLTVKAFDVFFGSNPLALLPSLIVLLSKFLYPIILYNIVLGVFNLIPVEPLDGFKIVNGLLPPRLAVQWVRLAPYGLYILIILLITGTTSKIIYPFVNLFINIANLR